MREFCIPFETICSSDPPFASIILHPIRLLIFLLSPSLYEYSRLVTKIECASYIFIGTGKSILFSAYDGTKCQVSSLGPKSDFVFAPVFICAAEQRYICGKLLSSPASFGDWSDSVLSGPQSVSCQYAASRTYSQRTRVRCVCDPAYVVHVDRVVSATRFSGILLFPRVFSLRDYSVCQVH